MDKNTLIGLLVGIGAILIGNAIEGGHLNSLMQFTAGFIVLGGTIGAVLVSNNGKDVQNALKGIKKAFTESDQDKQVKLISQIVECARSAKKEDLVSLESRVARIQDPFLKQGLRNLVDGIDAQQIREICEAEISSHEEETLAAAKVWQDAGGYSPTIGILGAVLGLIHVMGNLSDTTKLGSGIAVAFVATVYGVGLANLVFLPLGNKLKKRGQAQIRELEMSMEGVMMIAQGINPIVIEQKLKAYIKNN